MKKFISADDVLAFGGLGMLWYGLHLHSDCLAYSATGGMLFLIGLVGAIGGRR